MRTILRTLQFWLCLPSTVYRSWRASRRQQPSLPPVGEDFGVNPMFVLGTIDDPAVWEALERRYGDKVIPEPTLQQRLNAIHDGLACFRCEGYGHIIGQDCFGSGWSDKMGRDR